QGIGHHQYVLKFESDTNNIKFAVYDNTYIVAQSQDNSISKNTWAHVVGVANGTNLNVYVNGVESFKSTPAYNTISDVGTDILTIGEEGDSPNNYFEGSIDDVRVYDRALSLEQIKALYNERADLIVGDETEVYDVWQCRVTPFSYFTAGLTYSSNNITIIDAPKISNLLLNATSQNNLTTDDLTCNYDLNGSATTAAINWYKDSEPIMAFYMPMEGNEINALKDYSGNGIEIINENVSWNSTWGYDGNGSFHFTNETKMSTNGTGPEVSGDFTVTFWLKTNNFTDTKQSMVLMDSTWSTKEGWGFLDDGQWYNVFTFRIMGSGGHDDMRVSRSVVNDNSWHFVVGRLTERTGELIVDNVVRDSSTSVNFDPDAGDLDIGSDGSNSYFDGYLDDIRVYNYSLSDEQITALYESKADVIKSSETEIGEVWQCRVTPFDLEKAGKTYISNNITIEGANLYLRLTGKNEDYGSFLSYNINLSNLQSNPTPENQYVKFYMYVPNDYDIISNFSFSTSSYYTTTYENMSLPGGKIYQFTIEGITAQNSSLDSFDGISNSDNAWSLDFNFTGGLPQNILLGMDPEK
ncbi:MAG: LamG domain-containing protein, partial [Nanoarchaeota archaeon]